MTSQPTIHATAGTGPNRWPVVGALGLVVILGLAGALIWALVSGGDGEAGTTTTAPAAAVAGSGSDGVEEAAASTAPETAGDPADSATTAPPATAAASVGSISDVLIGTGDVDGSPIVFEDNTFESGAEPEHPLTTYGYCGPPPDLTGIGPSANRVIGATLTPEGVIGTTASSAASPGAAQALIDEVVAAASQCDSFDQGQLAKVTVVDVETVGERAEITQQVDSLTGGVEIMVLMQAVDDVVVTLEIASSSPDRDRLFVLMIERASAFTACVAGRRRQRDRDRPPFSPWVLA
jgi:hypothetical protein